MQVASDRRADKKHKRLKDTIKAMPYLLPAVISIIIFTIIPIVYTIVIAFTDYTMYSQGNIKFVGFANFIEVLTGPFKEVFLPVFGWNIIFAVVSTAGTFFLGLIVAMAVNNPNIKEKSVYRAILIIPWALPATVAILSWQGLLNGSYGAINNLLLNLHLISNPIPWLTDPTWARVALIIVNIWLGFPYMMNVCLGALGAIPDSYYEAADVDGASKWLQFRKITLPSLAQISYPLLISSFAFNFNNFGSAFLITKGGPPRMATQFAGYTDILASVNYKLSTQFGRFEIASAISIIIFLILGTISYYQMKLSGQFEEVE
ncbi:ABC transporter permease subunit [Clostridium perfringens]|uniref:Maltose/maltodextrin transport system permease protein n=7 Tax=Bacillota TaxID=1239 RepID=A0AAP6IVW0_CLOPF|nr:ABC transporter permease subunit [Clostridium perfringens]ABG84625.1 putative maltose/maltodextrin ABC transporter, permease protein [Clostridium perfringens ATCC 13124]AMN33836.1 sugar ABC transporter permease [Clostridium perfringens]AQW27962.1 sugar ABC transporter permease [Clostridium perfringens]ATD47549.1 sugar ABC transporter permease [Clostridium perfringens]EDT23718.1 putative maltose/maltodextrin ABC transporter, permease protein [Clostridium perfringens B str. ATCC 3626]